MYRLFDTLAILGLVLGAVVAKPVLTPTRVEARQTTTTCAKGVHIMIAGGCAVPCPSDKVGLLSGLVTDIQTAYPGSDTYLVPYNDSITQGKDSTTVLTQEATAYAQSCPKTKIVFLGYSLGGIVVMNTLCGDLSTAYVPNIAAAIVYGEETYRPGESYDAGTCTMNAPNFPRNDTALCTPYAPAIRNYCDSDDAKCCTGGTSLAAHGAYSNRYDNQAFLFIETRYPLDGPPQPPPRGSGLAAYLQYLAALAKYYLTHPFGRNTR